MYFQKNTLRFSIIFILFLSLLLYFAVHLILIQVFRSSYLSKLAQKQHQYMVELEAVRGTIFDRRMRPLAFNVPVYSIFANPRVMKEEDKLRVLRELPAIIPVDKESLRQRLNKDKYFVWLYRKVPADIAKKVKDLKLRGIDFRKESRRYYPGGELAAHVIGFAGVDNEGLEGLELAYDKLLKGRSGWMRVLRDARQRELMIYDEFTPPRDGNQLILTIDETIQYIAERALDKAFKKHNARGAVIVVMDVGTGEILALANRPTFDLAKFATSAPETHTNRAVIYMYEPGSVFKIVTASAALEENAFKETDKIFCENGQYRIANHILHDTHGAGMLTFQQVIENSSNIGTTKIAQKLGPNMVYKYADRFGFGRLTGIDLHGEVSGILKNPSLWSKTSIGAVPIGQEVTVTPLQLLRAIAAIANDGVLMKPYIVKAVKDTKGELIRSFGPEIAGRVISPDTAERMKRILAGVVERGTGQRAKIEGIPTAGKTGTAQKVEDGRYSHSKFYASFIGFAPVDEPRLAAVVVFDEPHPAYYGGTVAAPVFKEVMENSLKYLEVVEATGI